MKVRKSIALLLALCMSLAMLLTACGGDGGSAGGNSGDSGGGGSLKLIFAHNQTSTDHSFHLGAMKFKEEVEKLSNGQITVEVHAGDLGTNESELIEKVELGGADICVASPSFMGQVGVKEIDLLAFTYLFDDLDHWTRAIDGEYGQVVRDAVKEKTNFEIIGNFIAGVRVVYGKKFIKGPEDMQGLKIRVQDSVICTDYWKSIGAVTVSLGWGEMYQALQQNACDAAENSYVAFVLANHHTTTNGKYITDTNHDYATRPAYVNKARFESLTEEQRGWILEAMKTAEQYQRQVDAQLSDELKQRAIDEGAEVYEPTKAEIQFMIDAAVKQQDEFAAQNGLEAELKMIRDAK